MSDLSQDKQVMLEINKTQKEYYEFNPEVEEFNLGKGNLISHYWAQFRNFYYQMNADLGVFTYTEELHKKWMGDLSDKKILDLGCHTGNGLSLYLAQNAKEYVGIDLSESALKVLRKKFDDAGIKGGKLMSVDFLSSDFDESEFDIVYAKSVLHHFEYFDVVLERVKEVAKKNAVIVSHDPTNTYVPFRIMRSLYRPFQDDKHWEFPFTKEMIAKLAAKFEVVDILGTMGKAKNSMFYYILSKEMGIRKGKEFLAADASIKSLNDPKLGNCLGLSLKMINSK